MNEKNRTTRQNAFELVCKRAASVDAYIEGCRSRGCVCMQSSRQYSLAFMQIAIGKHPEDADWIDPFIREHSEHDNLKISEIMEYANCINRNFCLFDERSPLGANSHSLYEVFLDASPSNIFADVIATIQSKVPDGWDLEYFISVKRLYLPGLSIWHAMHLMGRQYERAIATETQLEIKSAWVNDLLKFFTSKKVCHLCTKEELDGVTARLHSYNRHSGWLCFIRLAELFANGLQDDSYYDHSKPEFSHISLFLVEGEISNP